MVPGLIPGRSNTLTRQRLLPRNFVEKFLVLCAHDEMTAQVYDAKENTWVLEDQHPLRKKGTGRGIHQSDVICSTVGWLKCASQSLEYGKNYEGYWTGKLFAKQVSLRVINNVMCLNLFHSSSKKLFQPSQQLMVLNTKLYF